MNRIHENLPDIGFSEPSSVTEATVCEISGKLASSGCPTVTEYFERSTLPTQRCTSHRDYSGDGEDSKEPYGPGSDHFTLPKTEAGQTGKKTTLTTITTNGNTDLYRKR